MNTLKKDELLVLDKRTLLLDTSNISYTSLSKCDTGAENCVTLHVEGLSEDYSISNVIEKEI